MIQSYTDYLKSLDWRWRRDRIVSERSRTCELCGDSGWYGKTQLDVHHLTYERVGQELDEDLVVLCRDCHKQLHDLPRETPLRSLKAIRLTTNIADYRAFVSGESLPVSRLDQHWVARYQL